MVAILDHQPPPAKRPQPNLILHCGAQRVERREIQRVKTPRATETWTPLPHLDLVTQVEQTLKTNGLVVGTQAHSLSHAGLRYFGLMEVQRTESAEDYCWVLGLRNSHDKTFPAGVTAGASVFVCDNLSFSGEVKLARKHTSHILRDLPRLVQSAVGKLMDRWHDQDARLSAYKLAEIEERTAHDLIVRAVDVGVCPNKLVPRVLHEWREPRYEAFQARNAWTLFNAFTEALKGNLTELPRRSEALHGLLDTHVGLDAPLLN
jgi:hypothetical protein